MFDSYALFAYFDNEEGVEIVTDLLARAAQDVELYLSIINLGEFVYASERTNGRAQADGRLEDLRRLPIISVGADENRVLAAAHIKANYRISYADAFAIALAQELNATIVTGDPEFRKAGEIVDVLWLSKTKRKIMRERHAAYRAKPRRINQV